MPRPRRVHLLIRAPRVHVDPADVESLRTRIRKLDPRIKVIRIKDRHRRVRRIWWALRPTMVFAIGPLKHFRPLRGHLFGGQLLPKSEQLRRLEAAGIPVPRWALVTKDSQPDLEDFEPYVVVKPDMAGRGADVIIRRKERVRWKPRVAKAGDIEGNDDLLVNSFIYTGTHPRSYRVVTLFGKALVAYRIDADPTRPALPSASAFREVSGLNIVSSSKGCTIRLHKDDEVIALAERTAQALPEVPLLGVDVVREVPSGHLYVLEVNPSGWTWHLSSASARQIREESGEDPYAQLHGLDRAAEVLVQTTRRYAR